MEQLKALIAFAILVAFTWVDPSGVQHWTDDPDRVPAAYPIRADCPAAPTTGSPHCAAEVEIGPLHEYPRYTGPTPSAR